MCEVRSTEFDQYAKNYDDALNRGLGLSGEKKEYFAERRVAWLTRCLSNVGHHPQSVLDYGCGVGTSTPFFQEHVSSITNILGVDISSCSIEVAANKYGSESIEFKMIDQYSPRSTFDLAYCNGVFHHIPINGRLSAARYIFGCLKHDGLFSFWENNPWNPVTRYIMNRIPFDKDAIMLSARESCNLLSKAGFKVLSIDFCFYFPRYLGFLRYSEPYLAKIPLGAQYQVLCRK